MPSVGRAAGSPTSVTAVSASQVRRVRVPPGSGAAEAAGDEAAQRSQEGTIREWNITFAGLMWRFVPCCGGVL